MENLRHWHSSGEFQKIFLEIFQNFSEEIGNFTELTREIYQKISKIKPKNFPEIDQKWVIFQKGNFRVDVTAINLIKLHVKTQA